MDTTRRGSTAVLVTLSSTNESVGADELFDLYRECGWMTPEQSVEMVATVLEFTDAVVSARTESVP